MKILAPSLTFTMKFEKSFCVPVRHVPENEYEPKAEGVRQGFASEN
jgi:hypothetical protein